jgi:hypothetical protein
MNQAALDRIRRFNKLVTNKILIHICGKNFGHFVILTHVGRKSGKHYRIPIIAEPVESGFVIALTYGRQVDWVENVLSKGSCLMLWKNQEYSLVHPEFIDQEIGVLAFPPPFRFGLKRMGVQYYLRLQIQQQ